MYSATKDEPSSVPQIVIVAIRWKGGYRSRSLTRWLASTTLQVIEIDAIDGVTWVKSQASANRRARREELVSGRPLADREIGASLSHRKAYAAAAASGARWTVIVEDDLRVSGESEAALLSLLAYEIDSPAIVNLQPGGGASRIGPRKRLAPEGTTRLSTTCLPVFELPPFAQAYALNKSALNIALAAPEIPTTSPDWPPWASACEPFVPRERVFHGEEGESLIADNAADQASQRYQVTRGEIFRRLRRRILFISWFGAREEYLSPQNYLRREFVIPARRYRHQLCMKLGRKPGLPHWLST